MRVDVSLSQLAQDPFENNFAGYRLPAAYSQCDLQLPLSSLLWLTRRTKWLLVDFFPAKK